MAVLDLFLKELQSAMYDGAIKYPQHVCVGTSTTPVTGADTTLGTEVGRGAATNGKVGNDITSYTKTWATTDLNGSNITEAGAIELAAGGVLANRKVFPAFTKTNQFSLRISIYIKCENNL